MDNDVTVSIQVDVVSDVVCPWCAIGYFQLVRASQRTCIGVEVNWHPFELNPGCSSEGENLLAHVAAKYGTTLEDSRRSRDRLTELGEALGFTFNYSDDMRVFNTFRAHQLIDWAGDHDRSHQMKMELFAAFFARRQNVSDPEILADVTAAVGLDRSAALAMLESGEKVDLVRQKERFWSDRGIQGVPAMVFARRHLLIGAQGEDNYARILENLAKESP